MDEDRPIQRPARDLCGVHSIDPWLTPKWQETCAPTFEGATAWVEENLPYVFSGKTAAHPGKRDKTIFEVDADAKALGTPNDARKRLERWIAFIDSTGFWWQLDPTLNTAAGQR